MKAILLKGKAGTGKTSLAEYFASQIGAFLYYLFHEWTTDEELFYSVDVGKVAVKDPYPYKAGILAKAIELSQNKPVVVCLDEIDKAKERVDTLLLDFIQNCRITDVNGNLVYGNPDNVYVFLTTNEKREVIEPLQRRIAKATLDFLPSEVEKSLILDTTDTYYLDKKREFILKYMSENPEVVEIPELANFIVKVANRMRRAGLDLSTYELKKFYQTLFIADERDEVEYAIEFWLVRNEYEYLDFLNNEFRGITNLANTLWGMLKGVRVWAIMLLWSFLN